MKKSAIAMMVYARLEADRACELGTPSAHLKAASAFVWVCKCLDGSAVDADDYCYAASRASEMLRASARALAEVTP